MDGDGRSGHRAGEHLALRSRCGKLTKLFIGRPELVGAPLVGMYPGADQEPRRHDPRVLPDPPGRTDPDGDGKPNQPVPLVLLVHGGPWARDSYGYNSWHQWLANRGYAVLSVNYRGSTGFGKKFISAGNLEWGRKMHDDLIDAVDWAVAQGVDDGGQGRDHRRLLRRLCHARRR